MPLLPVLRQISHLWDFERPTANAVALQMWAAAAQHPPFDPGEPSGPAGQPARGDLGPAPGSVVAVATVVLPDGRPIAITGSRDTTVQIWDLTAGTPVGDPLTGHTRGVRAAATVVLPDGRPIAVIGSHDATVRIWDLQRMTAAQEPLHLVGPVSALAALYLPTGVDLAVTGAGITAVELRHQAL